MNEFSQVMSEQTDDELLIIINEQRYQYQTQAVIAAEEELSKRNLSQEQYQKANNLKEAKKVEAFDKANTNLDPA